MTFQTIDLLDSNNYQTYNRLIARELGSVNAAIMLSELVNRHNYHRDKNDLKECSKYDGLWFYYTVEKCEERTVLSRKEQDLALSKMEKHEFFTKKIIGVPGKRHFQINIKNIEEFITGSKKDSRTTQRDKLDVTKGTNSNVPKGQTIHNKEHYKEPKEEEFVADDPVGSPLSEISIKIPNGNLKLNETDLYRKVIVSKKDWSSGAISYAWKTLAEYEEIVHDWWRFIEGTVAKYLSSVKSKRASGERDPEHKSQTRGKGKCSQKVTENQKNIKKDFSESDSKEQNYPELVCLGPLLERY